MQPAVEEDWVELVRVHDRFEADITVRFLDDHGVPVRPFHQRHGQAAGEHRLDGSIVEDPGNAGALQLEPRGVDAARDVDGEHDRRGDALGSVPARDRQRRRRHDAEQPEKYPPHRVLAVPPTGRRIREAGFACNYRDRRSTHRFVRFGLGC